MAALFAGICAKNRRPKGPARAPIAFVASGIDSDARMPIQGRGRVGRARTARSTSWWHHVSRSVSLRGLGFSGIPHGQTGESTTGF